MNCPIIEQTADGERCGRCWYYLPDGKTCPRHGDVSLAIVAYEMTGWLMLEKELLERRKKYEQKEGKPNV